MVKYSPISGLQSAHDFEYLHFLGLHGYENLMTINILVLVYIVLEEQLCQRI